MAFYTLTKEDLRKEIGSEVRRYFKEQIIPLKEVAETIGIAPQALSRYLTGKVGFSIKIADRLWRKYGLSITFLLSGNGPLLAKDLEKMDKYYEELSSDCDSSIRSLIKEHGVGNVIRSIAGYAFFKEPDCCMTIPSGKEQVLFAQTRDSKIIDKIAKQWRNDGKKLITEEEFLCSLAFE